MVSNYPFILFNISTDIHEDCSGQEENLPEIKYISSNKFSNFLIGFDFE